MSLPRYAEYKDSGIEWMGCIPSHWSVSQSRRMFRVRSEPALADDQMLTASQKYGVLPQAEFMLREGRRVVEVIHGIESLKHVEPDDFIISMRSFQGGIEWCRLRGSTSFHYVMLTPVKWVWPPFFAQVLKSMPYIQALRRTTDLIRDGQELRFSNFAQVPLPVVPIDEQREIATFLDRETGKIDALIAEQEKLLTMLAEKRQAIISHAVTRGLNPNAPMKDSGVPWLGEVPAHWDVLPLAYRYSIQLGKMLDAAKITGEYLRPYLRVFDVQWGSINTDELPLMDFDEEARTRYRLQSGDLIVNEGGSYPGRSAIWNGEVAECYYQKALHRVRPISNETDTTHFFYYVMNWSANRGVFVAGGNETTIEHLPAEKLRRYRFAFPPIVEQLEISRFLDLEVAKLDSLRTEAESAITLLKERRSALIAAAVTGKIDVRQVA